MPPPLPQLVFRKEPSGVGGEGGSSLRRNTVGLLVSISIGDEVSGSLFAWGIIVLHTVLVLPAILFLGKSEMDVGMKQRKIWHLSAAFVLLLGLHNAPAVDLLQESYEIGESHRSLW